MRHGRGGYGRGCRCEVCAAAQRDYMREWKRRKTGFYEEPKRGTCERCGAQFEMPRHGSQAKKRFCSRACQNHTDGRKRSCGTKPRLRYLAEVRAEKAARGTSSTWVWVQGTCIECGMSFTRHGIASPFCSKACSTREKRRARRAKQRGMKVTKIRKQRIHERDGWMCHICGDPVNRKAVVPALDAPTLDHVVALASGGSHDEGNLRTAHFYCNSVKRDLALEDVA